MKNIAQGLVVGKDGRLLLGFRAAHKKSYPHFWDLCGGHVEDEETVEEALVRELREELGIRATRYRALGAMVEPNPEVNGPKTYHTFLVEAWDGEPSNISDEHDVIEWFSQDEALALTALTGPARHAIETWMVVGSRR